jgi:hypothetical protein
MKRSRWLDLGGGVALVALGLGLGAMAGRLGQSPEPSRAATGASSLVSTVPGNDAKPSPDGPALETSVPRPDLSALPALRQLELLDHPARHGDADAACQLGHTLHRCLIHRQQRKPEIGAPHLLKLAELAEGHRDNQIEQIVRTQEAWQRMEAHCEGIDAEQQLVPMMQHLLRAALAGRANARVEFVSIRLSLTDLLRQPQAGHVYMQHAPNLFEQMLAEGDPRTIDVLHSFAGPQRPEDRQAGWHAIPEALRDRELARALWDIRTLRTSPPERLELALHLQSRRDPPINAAAWGHAEQVWNTTFERSPGVETLRARKAREYLDPRHHVPESERDRCRDDE